MGPFLIDTTAPVTTDNVPAGWSRTPVAVTLIPTDAGVIAYTQYALNGAAWSPYAGPFTVSTEGTSTLRYRSADAAGHVEATKTVSVRVDTQAPSVPTAVVPSAISTSSIEITWDPSTDTVSGLANYAVYRDGARVGTATDTLYTDVGLVPGDTYSYAVSALDVAGNESARSASASETVPFSSLWIALSSGRCRHGEHGSRGPVDDRGRDVRDGRRGREDQVRPLLQRAGLRQRRTPSRS